MSSKAAARASLETMMAQFNKPVTVVAEGAAALGHMTERDWTKQSQMTKAERSSERDPVNERYEVIDHLGRSHFRNGYGEWL